MSEMSLPWDDGALKRLEKIPSFVRCMAKDRIEKAATAAGHDRVTAAFMSINKSR